MGFRELHPKICEAYLSKEQVVTICKLLKIKIPANDVISGGKFSYYYEYKDR
jgi:hypothetical protein